MTPEAAALIETHLPLVPAVVRRLATRSRHARRLFDELVSAGRMGLVEAALRFDGRADASFGTFAEHRIHGAAIDELRRLGPYRRSKAADAVDGTGWRVAFTDDIEGLADHLTVPPFGADVPDIAADLEVALRQLPPRLERIVRHYYFGELTMRAIGAQMFVNESRISQLHDRALRRLRDLLQETVS